jgi:hypothetical protein
MSWHPSEDPSIAERRARTTRQKPILDPPPPLSSLLQDLNCSSPAAYVTSLCQLIEYNCSFSVQQGKCGPSRPNPPPKIPPHHRPSPQTHQRPSDRYNATTPTPPLRLNSLPLHLHPRHLIPRRRSPASTSLPRPAFDACRRRNGRAARRPEEEETAEETSQR